MVHCKLMKPSVPLTPKICKHTRHNHWPPCYDASVRLLFMDILTIEHTWPWYLPMICSSWNTCEIFIKIDTTGRHTLSLTCEMIVVRCNEDARYLQDMVCSDMSHKSVGKCLHPGPIHFLNKKFTLSHIIWHPESKNGTHMRRKYHIKPKHQSIYNIA